YGSFNVSVSQLDTLIGYIRKQEQHHRNITFQEEFLALLKKHRIEFDEQYLWDWVQPSLRDSLRSYVFPAVNCRAIIGSPFGTTAPFPPQKCPNSRQNASGVLPRSPREERVGRESE